MIRLFCIEKIVFYVKSFAIYKTEGRNDTTMHCW